jgi:hypothetical protein
VAQQALEEPRVAGRRHRLEAIREIAVVVIGARRHAGGDGRVELARVETPLLAGVSAKEQLVQFTAYRAHDDVFRRTSGIRLGTRAIEMVDLGGALKVEVEEPIHSRPVDRDGDEHASDRREHAMLVRPPRCESG